MKLCFGTMAGAGGYADARFCCSLTGTREAVFFKKGNGKEECAGVCRTFAEQFLSIRKQFNRVSIWEICGSMDKNAEHRGKAKMRRFL